MLQMTLIRLFLQPLSGLMKKMRTKTKDGIFLLSAIALFVPNLFRNTLFPDVPYILVYVWGCFWLGMMILSLLGNSIRPVAWNMPMRLLLAGTGALMLISALRFNVDWIAESVLLLVIVPVLSLVFVNGDIKRVYERLRQACIGSFLIYVVLSALLVPIHQKQYGGLIPNVNGAAIYLVLVLACLFVECVRTDLSRKALFFRLLLTGMCVALILYTNSRTGQLAAVAVFISVFGAMAVFGEKPLRRFALTRGLFVLLSAVMMMNATIYLIYGGNHIGYAIKDIFAGGAIESPVEDQVPSLDSFLDYNEEKLETDDKDLNDISTGRIDIWKAYLQECTLFGSGLEEKFWVPSRDTYYMTAHMVLLTYAFRHGYICALMFFGFNLLSAVRALRFARKHKAKAWALMPLAVTVAFGAISVVASINTPFLYMITIYYYFAQAPLLSSDVLPGRAAE